jgi:hypothetical protein
MKTDKTPDQPRTGLKWMNGLFLAFYVNGFAYNIIAPRSTSMKLGIALLFSLFIAAFLSAFVAARNPAHERIRKLAKWANLAALALALVTPLRWASPHMAHSATGYVGPAIVYGFILCAILGLPAFLNIRAFWNPARTTR